MVLRAMFLIALGGLFALTLMQASAAPPAEKPKEVVIDDLPPMGDFRAAPYLEAAVALQALGQEKAVKFLSKRCDDIVRVVRAGKFEQVENGEKAILLCRMLFVAKPKGEFRRPRIGDPSGIGDTAGEDWTLEPIELVDGVPFVVIKGYAIFGFPEMADHYLKYCVETCDWNPDKFKAKTADEKKKALEKLLASKKFKEPLTDDEKEFLAKQIK